MDHAGLQSTSTWDKPRNRAAELFKSPTKSLGHKIAHFKVHFSTATGPLKNLVYVISCFKHDHWLLHMGLFENNLIN